MFQLTKPAVYMYISISVVTGILLKWLTLSPGNMFYFVLQSSLEVHDLMFFGMKSNQKMLLKNAVIEHFLLMDIQV